MFIPFFILYNYKYIKSAVHHERHTALFSANRAIFNIYSSNYYLTPPAVFYPHGLNKKKREVVSNFFRTFAI